MEQLSLGLDISQCVSLKNVVHHSYSMVKKKFPRPVEGESVEEYQEFIVIEWMLEISAEIEQIALSRLKRGIKAREF
jgi:hypothetical protein